MAGGVERALDNLLGRARQDLATAEREEAAERGVLMGLIDRDRHLRYAMEQASTTIRTARDVEGIRQMRARLDTLEQERHAVMATRRELGDQPSTSGGTGPGPPGSRWRSSSSARCASARRFATSSTS